MRKFAWRRPALRPVHLFILALIVLGLLVRALGFHPGPADPPVRSPSQDVLPCSDLEIDPQAAHDLQAADRQGIESPMAAEATDTQENSGSEQAVVGPLHGNQNSKIFHLPGCRNYACKACTQVFQSREEALAAGYRPCRQCAQ